MFTGIVEEIGQLHSLQHHGDYARLKIQARKALDGLQTGDSISINGACQTVEQFDSSSFTVAAFAETLTKTNLGELRHGEAVHLERALTPHSRMGGHIVQGHVDGLGRLKEVRHIQDNYYLYVQLPPQLLDFCILHGSICLDGVSLTIARLCEDGVEINIIDHTWQHTVFNQRQNGASINVECDIVGKYLLRFAQRGLLSGEALGQVASKDRHLRELLQGW